MFSKASTNKKKQHLVKMIEKNEIVVKQPKAISSNYGFNMWPKTLIYYGIDSHHATPKYEPAPSYKPKNLECFYR